ncbi:ankyrin repeat domain-containing protein 26-like isoform X2 [Nannospalax galili]|uniref:ankyrin repeat domain-containing protein 26-like isoform X2 n=1 Tax=Nannospalax galili TaxID=1026970 RepID=UPI00111C7DD1|nr:ankyrin repeat domain-containing protein 26-like isoform X2 [Nannospalax galili]
MDRKCDIDLCDSDSSTPPIMSAQYGHEECMAILLERGAVPNAMDNCGNTALHYAVWSENISMAGKLLVHQASIDIKNKCLS